MSSSSGHGASAWSASSTVGPLAASLGDTLSQSRTQYHPGYMMSALQGNSMAQGNQRIDEAPLVPTKAKINIVLQRGSASDFGMDSMFESSRQRQRQTLTDEDAPPTTSVNDIPTEFYVESPSSRFQPRPSSTENSSLQRLQSHHSLIPQPSQPIYVIVFGYPPDKYTLTVEYFKSLGHATEPDLNNDITNCFKIGYYDAGDALRAVRKNGEVLGGSWMVGTKWSDAAKGEALFGQLVAGTMSSSLPPDLTQEPSNIAKGDGTQPPHRVRTAASTPTVGTPIKLVPSTSAFRKPKAAEKDRQQNLPSGVVNMQGSVAGNTTSGQSPDGGMIRHMSDLIFGW